MIGSDGKTAYSSRWSRDYGGALCMFGEWIYAKPPSKNAKEDLNCSLECTLFRKDTEANEVILGNANGIFKLRTAKGRPPSEQRNATGVMKMASWPRQPKGDEMDSTAFVMPPDLGV